MNRSRKGSGAQKSGDAPSLHALPSGDAPSQHALKRLITMAAAALLVVAIFLSAGNLLQATSVDPVQERSYYRSGFVEGYTMGRKLVLAHELADWRIAIGNRTRVQKAGRAVNRKGVTSLSGRKT